MHLDGDGLAAKLNFYYRDYVYEIEDKVAAAKLQAHLNKVAATAKKEADAADSVELKKAEQEAATQNAEASMFAIPPVPPVAASTSRGHGRASHYP